VLYIGLFTYLHSFANLRFPSFIDGEQALAK